MKTFDALGRPPSKFHKFVHYLFLPVRFVALAITFSDSVAYLQYYNTFEIFVSILITALLCVLSVVAFVGFFKLTSYSLFSLFAYFFLDVVSSLYVLISSLWYFPEEAASSIGRFCGAAIVAILICIYYWKRRNFFLHKDPKTPALDVVGESLNAVAEEQVEVISDAVKAMDMPVVDANNDAIKYCHKCRKKLLPESAYCRYCGVKVNDWED